MAEERRINFAPVLLAMVPISFFNDVSSDTISWLQIVCHQITYVKAALKLQTLDSVTSLIEFAGSPQMALGMAENPLVC